MSILYPVKGRFITLLLKLLPVQQPIVLKGKGSALSLCEQVAVTGYKKVLIITDEVLHKLGTVDGIKAALEEQGVTYVIYDGVLPNPEFTQVEEALDLFEGENCEAVIAVGGGSVIDAAKMVAMMHHNPGKLKQFDGIQKFKNPGVVQFVVPSTSGTGSEVSIASVISDPDTHNKVVVVDTKMVPQYVALDSDITKGMPPSITAATGIDALTHAVESYLTISTDQNSMSLAKTATKLVMANLFRAYQDGTDIQARDSVALGAYYAGVAMNRTTVGYVHGVAHQLGRLCNTPHGNANAMLLPEVIGLYGKCADKKLAELAAECGIGDTSHSDQAQAQSFIQAIVDLRSSMDMPLKPKEMKSEYVDDVVQAALEETGGLYPVPRYLSAGELRPVVEALL